MQEYKDRSQSEIYGDIKSEFDKIDGPVGNLNRDDEDAYKAAMRVINKYFSEDFEVFNKNNKNLIDNLASDFAFREYTELYNQLKKEHDDLELKNTNHYRRTSVEPHIQRLAGRINSAERTTLINRYVNDAKHELIYGNNMIDAEETSKGHSDVKTRPFMTAASNGKTISEVLKHTTDNNPDINPNMTYTLDYSKCKDPKLQEIGRVTVNSEGKLITKGENPNINEIKDLPACEGVMIASSKYLDALNTYTENINLNIDEYTTEGGINQVKQQNYQELDNCFGHASGFNSFDEMIKELNKNQYSVKVMITNKETGESTIKEKEVNNEYKNCISLLENFPTLFNLFKKEYELGNYDILYNFLSATETKLDHVVKKNKKMGLALAELPIETASPGLAQANFVGDVDITNENTSGGGVREVLFKDDLGGGFQGQRCNMEHRLYELLNTNKGALKDYLTQRIKQKRGDGQYAKRELTETIISDSETKTINGKNNKEIEKAKEDFEIKQYQLEKLTELCYEFSAKFGKDENIQPAQLVKIEKYLENTNRDLEKLFINDGKLPSQDKRNKICKKVQEDWLDFKNNDGSRATISDSYACTLISLIFNAGDRNNIQEYIKELGNGMTLFDNTTGSGAISDAISDSKNEKGTSNLEIKKSDFDKCRKKIDEDFHVNVDKEGNIIPNANIDNILNECQRDWKAENVLGYLQKHGYLPRNANINDERIKQACENILHGLLEKKLLLLEKYNNRMLNPGKMKEKLKKEKENLSRMDGITDDQLAYLNGIDAILEDEDTLNELIKSENEAMELSIKYGGTQDLIAGSLTGYLIKEGGGVSLRGGGKSSITEMINDSYGTRGIRDFSDENCEEIGPILENLLLEVAILTVAIAAGSVTAGTGSAAIMALRATVFGARTIKLANNIKRVSYIANLCKRAGTGTKYVGSIGNKLRNLKRFKPTIARTATEAAAESSRLGKATLAAEKAITSTNIGAKMWNGGAKVIDIIKSGNEAIKLGKGMKIAGFLLDGTGFHITNTAIHNAINRVPLSEGLNPFGSTEYIDPETGETKTVSNLRGYTESIAFLGVLKAIGSPIQGLTQNTLGAILNKKVSETTLKGALTGGSITGEVLGMSITDQILSISFDQKLKDITVDDLVHSIGMVLGLRMTRSIGGMYKKYVVKEYNKAKGEVVVEADGKTKITVNANGTIVNVSDINGKPIINSELKGKNLYNETIEGPQNEKEQKMFEKYIKEKENQLRTRYKILYKKELGITSEKLKEIIREKDLNRREELINNITDKEAKDYIEREFNEIDFNQEEINQSNSKKTDDSEIKANEEINNEELTEFLNKIKESYRQEAGEELELTDEQAENIKKIKELGVEINTRDIIKIKELNEEWIDEYITKGLKESINKIKNELGIKVYYQDIESLKDIELTENQINNIKKILDVIGTNIFARDILILKDIELTDEQIENIKKIKELGIEIYPMNIESLKDMTKEQIENVNKIKNEYGIETYTWQIESIKNTKLTKEQIENIKIINNEILTLSASDIEPLKDITREQIENVKKIKELGIEIYISKEIESLKDITNEQIKNIKRIKELGIKVKMDDIESIRNIELTENQIESINKIKNEFGSDLSLNDIKIIDNNKEIFEINNDDFYKGYNYDKEGIEAHKEIIRGKIIDEIQQYIQKVIPENRDIGETEILEKVRLSIITLPKSERLGFLNKISDLVKKFNNVRKYLDFENGPYKSPEELFCAAYKPGLFNFIDINKYRGKVRVIQHGSGMVFYIGDSPILNSLYGKLWSNGNIFNKYTSSGFNSIESKIPELEGTISIVAGSQKNDYFGTTIHEGQHNRNTDFMPDKNQGPITYSKDEILAHLKCNTPIPIIKYNLCTPGGYQYGLKGEKREAHKKQVRQLCSYAEDLIKLTKDSNTTGLTRDKVISMLSDTPADKWEELHSNIMESIKLHSQENSTQETVKNLRQRFISKIKERARNYRLVENLTNYRNFLFPNYKIDLEKPEFWRAGTAKIETAINEIKSCNTLEEIKHILNDPKYSHIGRGPNNKGGMEISTIIDEIIAGRQKIDDIPEEIRPKIQSLTHGEISQKKGGENLTRDESEYFGGKSPKIFNVEDAGGKAIENSKMMDNLLNEINREGISQEEISSKLQELRNKISEQYNQATGEELKLTDEQLLSIIDAHEQDGILGELSLGELRQKVKVLDETITDPKIKRFLLEAGFCGKIEIISDIQNNIPSLLNKNKKSSINFEFSKNNPKLHESFIKTGIITKLINYTDIVIEKGGNLELLGILKQAQEELENLPYEERLKAIININTYIESAKKANRFINLVKRGGTTAKELFLRAKGENTNRITDFEGEITVKQYRNSIVFEFEKSSDVIRFFKNNGNGLHFASNIAGLDTIMINKENCKKAENLGMNRENAENRTILHESQHTINKFFMTKTKDITYQEAKDPEKTDIESFKQYALDRAKDEIIAQYTNRLIIKNLSKETISILSKGGGIKELLTKEGNVYDYFKERRNTPEGKKAREEYIEKVKNLIDCIDETFKTLLNSGFYSDTNIQNVLNLFSCTNITERKNIQNMVNNKFNINEYFDGKSHKFEVTESQARGNSEMMDSEGLIFDPKYITQKDAGIYRFNTKETTETQKNKPGYQSLQEAEQSLNNQIGGKYDKKLYQESFTKKHKNEDFEEDVDDFIKYATEKELNHKQIFLDLAKEASAKALFIGGPKKKDRIIEKVRNELLKEGEGLEALTDFTRATILFDNFSNFEEGLKVLEKMKNEGRILDLKIRNRLTRPGCNDIFVNIQTPDGYVSEVQFHIPEVLVFRDEKLGDLSIDRYKSDNNILDKHTLTKDIFDLSNDKYKRNLEPYNKIIDRLNEGRDKDHLLSLPKEQDQIVYDHDMYDIIRVLEVYENADNLTLEDYELFTSKGFKHENIKDLLNDLRLMKEHLCNEALNRYRKRTK